MKTATTSAIQLFLFFFTAIVSAQVRPVPAWVEEFPARADLVMPRGKDEGNSYLLVDEQYSVPHGHVYFHYAIRVNAETGLHDASQIEISFDPSQQQAFIHYIKVHRKGQVQDRTRTETIRVLDQEKEKSNGILSGAKSLYVNLTDVRVGDVVEYAYSRQGDNRIFSGNYNYYFDFSYDVPVGELRARMIFPKNSRPLIRNVNIDIEPQITDGAQPAYTWTRSQLAPVLKEAGAPSWFNPNAVVYISSFSSWEDVKKWAVDLFRPGKYDRSELISICDSISRRHPGNLQEQVNDCVTFVQDNVRYSGNEQGIYSHQPHSPDWVLANRFGDCKDKSMLLAEMLRHLGIRAWPALTNTSLAHTVPALQPSFARFNHCITAISFNGSMSFVDATAILERGPFQERSCATYGTAMVLDSTGNTFTAIPPDPVSGTKAREEFTVLEGGDAVLKATFRFSGERANETRRYFAGNALNVIQESYTNVYTYYADTIEVLDTVTFRDDAVNNIFETTEHYKLKNFWVQKKTEAKVQRSFIPSYLNRTVQYPEEKSRKHPFVLTHPAKIDHVIVLHIAGGVSVPPALVSEDNDYFSYRYQTEAGGDSLVLSYSYTTKTREVPAAQFGKYLAATENVSNHMIFTAEQHELDETEHSFNWLLMCAALVTLGMAIVACLQLGRNDLHYGHENRYSSIGGWLVLLAIGIILTPVTLLFQIVTHWRDQWQVNYFSYYYNAESYGYDPFRGTVLTAMYCCNLVLLVGSVFMLFQLFRRRNTFRLYYTFYKLFNFAVLLSSALFTYFFFYTPGLAEEEKALNEERTNVMRVAIQAMIWIPYLWYSRRSRHTFTEGAAQPTGERRDAGGVVSP